MALNIHGNGVHGDMGSGRLDVNREGGRISAQTLRADAEAIHGGGQLTL